jgi:23S rRNA (uracil1939-C5)-methyltransferase
MQSFTTSPTITIQRVGIHGEGVGVLDDGRVVFVNNALPGEVVKVVVTEVKKKYVRATVLERLKTSPFRINPICPDFGKCGGCQLLHLDYKEQLRVKRQRVVDVLERIGKFFDVDVPPCLPSEKSLYYRNKAQLPVMDSKIGLYAYNSHDLVEIDKCYIHCELGELVFQHIRRLLLVVKSNVHYVLIKTAIRTRQILVVLVTKMLEDLGPLAQTILDTIPQIRGVVQNIAVGSDNTILGKEFFLLKGDSFIEEEICGLRCKISAPSFFQVNPPQAEALYKKAIDFCALTGQEVVLDAYCGIGIISLLLAQKAKFVFAIEFSPQAIADGIDNAKKHNITNIDFQCIEAERAVLPKIDVALINPPRKGCLPPFLEQIIAMQPSRIVYISCDPATLARDLAALREGGYYIQQVQPFDMFPQTVHVETVVKLQFGLC